MKITPIATSGAQTEVNLDEGRSAGSDRVARAKAILAGQDPAGVQAEPQHSIDDRQAERAQKSIKRIRMKTQASPDRYKPENTAPPELYNAGDNPSLTTQTENNSATLDTLAPNEQTSAEIDATKPLSPQYAALAKAKRALQVKERELLAREEALKSAPTTQSAESLDAYKAKLKESPLRMLLNEGVTYDQLTEELLSEGSTPTAAVSKLEMKLKELEERLENQTKTLKDGEEATEKQVFDQMGRDLDRLIAEGDDYQMVREAGYAPKVLELIKKTWQTKREVLDVAEAARLVEDKLLEQSLRFAKIPKVQSKLTPAQIQSQQAAAQGASTQKIMRTLTNKDGASVPMSARERAIAAFYGRKQ